MVESRRDWKGAAPAVRLVIAGEYLSDPAFAEAELHVINLCRSMRYQSLGYYCSLLAEARGHRVLASVATLQDLSRKILYGSEIPALAQYLDALDDAERAALPAHFNVYLGQCENPVLAPLARRLFEQFAVPLLHVDLRHRKERVSVAGLRTLSIRALEAGEADCLARALDAHVAKGWRSARSVGRRASMSPCWSTPTIRSRRRMRRRWRSSSRRGAVWVWRSNGSRGAISGAWRSSTRCSSARPRVSPITPTRSRAAPSERASW